jgi:multiple sugar transport system ATP-binding protein
MIMAKAITLDGFTKRYGSMVAVDDISLDIPAGEFVSIVGPSGSGKTTLLRMIAGLETPTVGRILFDDKDMTTVSPQDRPLSMVFQNIALFPHMTCRENVGYGLKIHGMPKAERDQLIDEAAKSLQIEDQLEKVPSELSGGQQQRVALGRAFVEDPDVLLLDEPMSDLDAKLKEDLRIEFQRLHRELDATFVYVTHDQREAMTMSDEIAVMRKGTVEQFGDPETIFHDPDSEYIATFIGTPSTNIIEFDADGELARRGTTSVPLPAEARDEERVRVGFRPQYLRAGGGEVEVDVLVDVIEPLGVDYVVHATTVDDSSRLDLVTTDVSKLSPGDKITVGSRLADVFLFRADGRRIRSGAEGGVDL